MYLTYLSTVCGDDETKRIDLTGFEQDKTSRWYSAEAWTALDHYTISRYMHLWHNGKCIGTQVKIFKS